MDLKFSQPLWRYRIGLLLSLLFLCGGCNSIANQPRPGRRALTEAELTQLRRELKQAMDKMPETIKIAPRFSGWFSKAEEAQFEEQRSSWVLKNPIIGPYVGQRGGSNVLTVYPSKPCSSLCCLYLGRHLSG